jgi:hypothetical protein
LSPVSLQGATLASSDRGGIRVQYSKNPFGKKRDYHGNMVDNRDFAQPSGGGEEGAGGAGVAQYQPQHIPSAVPGLGPDDGQQQQQQQQAVGGVDLSGYAAQGPPIYDAGVPPGIA